MIFQWQRAAVAASILSSMFLGGCAPLANQPLNDELRGKIESTDTITGVKQNELYAAINPSNVGASGAAACGAIPGIGILLAGVCGGIMGATDASINAGRAKEAEATVRPLKDALIDFNFDTTLQSSLSTAVTGIPKLGASKVTVTKSVTSADYDKALRDSTASTVLFVTADYHMSPDFSSVLLSVRGSLFPRAPALRVAAGQPSDLPSASSQGDPLTHLSNAIYKNVITYEARLPNAAKEIASNIETWKADNAALLLKALNQGIAEITAALAQDLQYTGTPAATATPAATIRVGVVDAAVVTQSDNGTLARLPNGTLKFIGQLVPATSVTSAAK